MAAQLGSPLSSQDREWLRQPLDTGCRELGSEVGEDVWILTRCLSPWGLVGNVGIWWHPNVNNYF